MFTSFSSEAFDKLTSTSQSSLNICLMESVMAVQEEVRCWLNLQTTSTQRVDTAFKVMIKSMFIKMTEIKF